MINRKIIGSFIGLVCCFCAGSQAVAQSNRKALEYLVSLREPTYEISSHFLAYTKLVLLEGLTKKSVRDKAAMLEEVIEAKEKIRDIPTIGGQDKLTNIYLNYFSAMETYLKSLPTVEIESVEYFDSDSATKFQKAHVTQLNILFKDASNLKSGFEKFCILNKVQGVKTSGGLTPKQAEAVNLISHAVKVSNAVMNVRKLNRLFFISLREDTGFKAEETRQQLVKAVLEAKATLAAVPNFLGDLTLKKRALMNVRLAGISASKDYIRLLKFRDEEIKFIAKTLEFKENIKKDGYDTELYYKELKRFSALMSINRKELKALGQTRLGLEKAFNDNFLKFVEEMFVL